MDKRVQGYTVPPVSRQVVRHLSGNVTRPSVRAVLRMGPDEVPPQRDRPRRGKDYKESNLCAHRVARGRRSLNRFARGVAYDPVLI